MFFQLILVVFVFVVALARGTGSFFIRAARRIFSAKRDFAGQFGVERYDDEGW